MSGYHLLKSWFRLVHDAPQSIHKTCLGMCRYDDDYLLHGAREYEDYDDVHTGHGWAMDSFFRPPRVPEQEQGHVWLDSHILANPAIADIDGDGQEELVVAVSYYFDRDQYSRPVSCLSPLQAEATLAYCVLLC